MARASSIRRPVDRHEEKVGSIASFTISYRARGRSATVPRTHAGAARGSTPAQSAVAIASRSTTAGRSSSRRILIRAAAQRGPSIAARTGRASTPSSRVEHQFARARSTTSTLGLCPAGPPWGGFVLEAACPRAVVRRRHDDPSRFPPRARGCASDRVRMNHGRGVSVVGAIITSTSWSVSTSRIDRGGSDSRADRGPRQGSVDAR